MLFTTILAFAAGATAIPAMMEPRQAPLCSGAGQPFCCATDVLNLADLDCHNPPQTPTGINSFIDICSAEGQQAKCCVLPLLGQALFCADVNPQVPAPSAAPAAAPAS